MPGEMFPSLYPHLFQKVIWPWGPTQAQFVLLEDAPPQKEIANVNIVPTLAGGWVVLQLANGTWDIPGGTLEPGESYLEAIRRELKEEAGAQLISHHLLGAWSCISLADKPFRPHLPHPQYYRLVITGEIRIVELPENPPGDEKVISVVTTTLADIADRFISECRYDLAVLYQLAEMK